MQQRHIRIEGPRPSRNGRTNRGALFGKVYREQDLLHNGHEKPSSS
jgi:hypothetical protein